MRVVDIISVRDKAAEAAFNDYNFGSEVEAVNGWEIHPGERRRTVFLKSPEAGLPSVKVIFHVFFRLGKADIAEVKVTS